MTNIFCTILTADYYPKALALYKSLARFGRPVQLEVLIADNKPVSLGEPLPVGIRLIPVSDLAGYSMVDDLYRKYAHTEMDSFRWSLKPVFISYLLEKEAGKVIYLDCDMFFFNDYNFLFAALDESSVLLTPNWINHDPAIEKESFFSLFTSGFFSAGFIGATKEGLAAMQWWADACHFMMGEHIEHGIREDQKYLDIFPVYFGDTKIIRHRGCNIGAWNYDECRREFVNNTVLINGIFPVVFIHFDDMLIKGILRGYDKLLLPYLEEYKKVFEESGAMLSGYIGVINSHAGAGMLTRLKWNVRLRTRIKRIFYRWSQRL